MPHLFAKPLSLETQNKLIHRVHQEILARCRPLTVILFGSAARGEMTDASDLDLVVIMSTAAEAKTAQKALNQLSRILDWPVDCLVIDEPLFQRKSKVGGVYMVAAEDGRIL